MDSKERDETIDRLIQNLLESKNIYFEDVAGILELVHPLCQDCLGPCFTNGGHCPFEFSEFQLSGIFSSCSYNAIGGVDGENKQHPATQTSRKH